jgi:hypothetical protein
MDVRMADLPAPDKSGNCRSYHTAFTGRNAFRRNGIHVGRGLWRPFAVSRRKDITDVAGRDRQGV